MHGEASEKDREKREGGKNKEIRREGGDSLEEGKMGLQGFGLTFSSCDLESFCWGIYKLSYICIKCSFFDCYITPTCSTCQYAALYHMVSTGDSNILTAHTIL